MLKKTRIKLFITIFVSMFGIFLIFVLVINFMNASDNSIMDDILMDDILEFETGIRPVRQAEDSREDLFGIGGGPRPPETGIDRETENKVATIAKSRYYIFKNDGAGSLSVLRVSKEMPEPDETYIEQVGSRIVSGSKTSGNFRGMKYKKYTDNDSQYIIILDAGDITTYSSELLKTSRILVIIAFFAFGVFAWFISKVLVRPIGNMIEMQERFISDASHELKTPLSVINANIDVLEKEIGDNKWLANLKEEGRRMTGMTNELLELSQIEHETRKKGPVYENVDISRAVTGIVLPFEGKAYEKGVRINTDISEGINIRADRNNIGKLTDILVDNAIRHSPEGGTVTVSLKDNTAKPYSCILRVRNEGEPIPKENLPHIFDRFYKGNQIRQNAADGAATYGLGLSIAKAIVYKYKGSIKVSSDDSGTEFTVYLR